MSRFNKLEFSEKLDGQLRPASQPGNQQVLKDESYYLKEARSAFESGQFEAALRCYAKILEFNTRNPVAWSGQVRMLIELGRLEEAKSWADQGLERFPDDAELLAAKAVVLARSGDLPGALAYSDASVGEPGETPYVWLARGDVQLARQERRADYCFEKAFALAPRDWFIRWLASRILHYYRKFVQALKQVQEALSLDGAQGVLWIQFGFCQQALGLVGPARTSFQHARQFEWLSREADDAIRALYRQGLWTRLRGQWRRLFDG
jgi:tetratricopeptide (TPR) repeat protein